MGLQLNEQSSGWISTPPTRSAWYSLCSARTAQLSVETPLLIMLPVRLQILFTLENKQDLISWNHLIEKGHKNKTRRRGKKALRAKHPCFHTLKGDFGG